MRINEVLKKAVVLVLVGMGVSIHASSSWMSTKLEVRFSSVAGKGIFAKETISKHERLIVYGGKVMTKDEVLALSKERIPYVLQIEDDLWLGSEQAEDADFLNHSCNAN